MAEYIQGIPSRTENLLSYCVGFCRVLSLSDSYCWSLNSMAHMMQAADCLVVFKFAVTQDSAL